ncbi:MAG: terminase large subunit domain-containing protein [Solimonas sp.]
MAAASKSRLELLRIKAERLRRLKYNRLAHYKPYPKQAVFHEAGRLYRERMLKAGNQQGKTWSAGAEVAMHLTGRYPDDWKGKRFDKPIAAWAAGVTGESTRDNPQRILMGRIGQFGTGAIPKECLIDHTNSRGVADALDTVLVRHASGGVSILQFKSYEKGREKWQGETLDLIWFDEEPPLEIYTEGITRTNATKGCILITYTPLQGMSEVTCLYLKDPTPDRHVTNMTINDALHYSPEERAQIIASYPAHEREARVNGVPMMGSGRIFPLSKEAVSYEPIQFPPYFRRLAAVDFGWDHPFAAVWGAYDPDADVIYIYDAYRRREAGVIEHAAVLRAKGVWIPVAWPHDGLQHDKGSGEQLAEQFRKQGINMLHEHAQFPPTKQEGESAASRISVEAGLSEMLERFQTGRLKVASHLNDWFEEFLMYHREEGKVVKEMDDLISATRYLLMMLRHATTRREKDMPQSWRERLKNRNRGRGSAMTA